MTNIDRFVQSQINQQTAYDVWSSAYEAQFPRPPKPPPFAGRPWLMIPFGLIAVSAIILSALRTAPIFQKIAEPLVGASLSGLEAALALVVIEVSLVITRYMMVLHANETHTLDVQRLNVWMMRGFWLAFFVAVGANIYASVAHVILEIPSLAPALPVIDLAMATVVGVSAPILAFISGDILAMLWITSEKRRADLLASWEESVSDWNNRRDRRWERDKSRLESPVVVRELSPQIPEKTETRSKRDILFDHFREHPESLTLSAREIERLTGVSKSYVAPIRKEFLESHHEM
jgi:hypothetical protein